MIGTSRRQLIASAVAVLLLATSRMAFACPVCFGASDGPLIAGSNAGIAVLIAITAGILAGVAAFVVHLSRKARQAAAGAGDARVAARPGLERPAC